VILSHVDGLTLWNMGLGVAWRFQSLVHDDDLWKHILHRLEQEFIADDIELKKKAGIKTGVSHRKIFRSLTTALSLSSPRKTFPWIRTSISWA
jgi:hypothetical protein